ncbi:glycosyltransferase family 87 protein [Roseiarcaceae bacterium H3SJ34-1]|uniref:glycosyltransferase family 87 protein n=1 Tax=Terripilifer ovatus TaxID=3032367 RepID=UPI003AB92FF1|nr:glycosyltransferase family 87 protein [Roseiarcaceae bacterium H3SJ34-1]
MLSTIFSRNPDLREAVRGTAFLSAFAFIAFWLAWFSMVQWRSPIPWDGSGMTIGKDFFNFWMYGREAFSVDPGRFYDLETYQAAVKQMLGPDSEYQPNWSYPPSIMLLAPPFGALPYVPALVIFTLAGIAAYFAVLLRRFSAFSSEVDTGSREENALFQETKRVFPIQGIGKRYSDWRLAGLVAISPAAIICLNSGQFAYAITALLVAIFWQLDRRPILAGVLIGALSLKPQLGLFLPVMLIASGRWQTFAVAALTTLALAGLTTVLYGAQPWLDYLHNGIPTQNLVLRDPLMLGASVMPTVFMNLRQLGLSYETAMALQACAAVVAAGAIFWAFRFRRDADPDLLFAFYFACCVFGLPYLLSYDTMPLTLGAAVLLLRGKLDAWGMRWALLVWWLPFLQMGMGILKIPGPGLVAAPLFAWWLFQRLRDTAPQGAASGILRPA